MVSEKELVDGYPVFRELTVLIESYYKNVVSFDSYAWSVNL